MGINSLNTTIVKVGSDLLTTPEGFLDLTQVQSIAHQIVTVREQVGNIVLVTSGAVAAGRGSLGVSKMPHETSVRRQAYASVGQGTLFAEYRRHFMERGVHAAQVLINNENLRDDAGKNGLFNLFCEIYNLPRPAVAVCNANDSVAIDELMWGDNDGLAGHIAELLNAAHVLILTTRAGLLRDVADESSLIARVPSMSNEWEQYISRETGSHNGTGGMESKCRVATQLAAQGISTRIASGRTPRAIERIWGHGEELGTLFEAHNVSVKK